MIVKVLAFIGGLTVLACCVVMAGWCFLYYADRFIDDEDLGD